LEYILDHKTNFKYLELIIQNDMELKGCAIGFKKGTCIFYAIYDRKIQVKLKGKFKIFLSYRITINPAMIYDIWD